MGKKKTKDTKKGKKEDVVEKNKGKKKKSKVSIVMRVVLLILLITAICYAIFFTKRMELNGGGLQGFLATVVGHNENTLKNLDPIYFMLIGISGSEETYKLADTIMLCSYDPKLQEASILSIPRDTYVGKDPQKASASYKINAVYRNGENIEGMMKSIKDITGVDVKNYVIVDTAALRELVDAVGGVYFDVPKDMLYDDKSQNLHINLSKGYQLLDGKKAEQLVRYRHDNDTSSTYSSEYGEQDIGRTRTQRNFLAAVMKQTLKPGNVLKIGQIMDIASKNVKTNIDFDLAKDYIPYAVNFNTENLKMDYVPGESKYYNKVWIYVKDNQATKEVVSNLFPNAIEGSNKNGQTTNNNQNSNNNVTIELLNGSGSKTKLTDLKSKLEKAGYKVSKTGDTSATAKTTIIDRTGIEKEDEDKIKELTGAENVQSSQNNSKVNVTIIIGQDYK